jgi:hypothetical protein
MAGTPVPPVSVFTGASTLVRTVGHNSFTRDSVLNNDIFYVLSTTPYKYCSPVDQNKTPIVGPNMVSPFFAMIKIAGSALLGRSSLVFAFLLSIF